MLAFLKGYFGNVEIFALQDFEAQPLGDIDGTLLFPGETDSGHIHFEAATFGSRQ